MFFSRTLATAILFLAPFLGESRAQSERVKVSVESLPQPPRTYEELAKKYAESQLVGYFPPPREENEPPSKEPYQPTPLLLRVTAIENDSDDPPADVLAYINDRKITYGCHVSETGRVSFFYHSSMGTKGGGYPQIPAEDLRRLSNLLTQLPPDGGVLPPNNRRLILQYAENGISQTKIYDRANSPDLVRQILHLSLSGIRSWVPEFKPAIEWEAHRRDDAGLAVLPGSGAIITVSQNSPIKVWDTNTQEMTREITTPRWFQSNAIRLNPVGDLAVVGGRNGGDIYLVDLRSGEYLRDLTNGANSEGDLASANFSPDGKYIFARDTQRRMVAFDGRTGDPIPLPPGMAENVSCYHSESGTPLAVFSTLDDQLILWNSSENRQVTVLDKEARLHEVAFSPDRTLVAVATKHTNGGKYWTKYRIRVWKAVTGESLNELNTFEQPGCEGVAGLQWTRDGRYLLAATKPDAFLTGWGVQVWNPYSGRQRGALTNEGSEIQGLSFLHDDRLVAIRNDGRIVIWDAAKAFEEIRKFEEGLAQPKGN